MNDDSTLEIDSRMLQAHPWHGIDPMLSEDSLWMYVENTPLAKMKYEIDVASGILKVDHSHETSALPPEAYGFIPRTLCGSKVAQLRSRLRGDRAPLDVFLLSDRPIEVPGVLAEVRIIGGIPQTDEGSVDDKLVAVLIRDAVFGRMQDIAEVPVQTLDRICHYLREESVLGGSGIGDPYGRERAQAVLQAARNDYDTKFGY